MAARKKNTVVKKPGLFNRFKTYYSQQAPAEKIALWGIGVTVSGIIVSLIIVFITPPINKFYDALLATATFTPTPLPTATATPSLTPTPTLTFTPAPTPTATATPTPPFQYETFLSAWTNLQTDAFETDTLDQWTVGEHSQESSVTPSISDGALRISISTKDHALYETFIRDDYFASGDMALSMEAKLLNQGGCGYGLVFKGDASDDYYVFSLYNEESYSKGLRYSVTKVTPALPQKRQVIEIGRLSLAIGIPDTLSVVSVGDNSYFFVNDQPLTMLALDKQNNSIHGGRVGIEVLVCPGLNADFKFDNFQLRTPTEAEKSAVLNLPNQFNKVVYASPALPQDNVVNEAAAASPDIPDGIDISSEKDSDFNLFPNRQIQSYKVSARFYNPTESSWSYGFLFSQNDNNLCDAYIRSDSVFAVKCLGTKYYGVIDNLQVDPGAYNELEIQVKDEKMLLKVNNKVFFYTAYNEPLPKGWVSLDVAWDDERSAEYTVHIDNVQVWSPPDQ